MSLSQVNPMDIPEIIAIVGRYIKELQDSDVWGPTKIHTKELYDLTLVSKTWQAALIPVLWEDYNGAKMLKTSKDVISKYSQYSRTISNFKHPGPFICSQVKRIDISPNNTSDAWLLKQPLPRLTTIRMRGSELMWGLIPLDLSDPNDDTSDETSGNIQENLIRLSTLPKTISSLELYQCSIPDLNSFSKLLQRFSNLSSLTLTVSALWEHFSPTSDGFVAPTPNLPTIKYLCLDFTHHINNGVLCFIPRCPNLEKLRIVGSWFTRRRNYRRTPFHEFIPKLRELDIDSMRHLDSTHNGPNSFELALLLQDLTGPKVCGPGRLQSIRISFAMFNQLPSYSIASQSESLENLDLELGVGTGMYRYKCDKTNKEDVEESEMFKGVANILKRCTRLQRFSLRHEYYKSDGCASQASLLFSVEWPCSGSLQELTLLLPPSRDSLERTLEDHRVDFDDEDDGKDGCGKSSYIWRAESKIRLEKEFEKLIFEKVKHMPKLWKLKLNKVRIFKINKESN
ncbi:hypothetical protein BGZ46_004076 [Entomortierella lignicola]|nr:hypothetical protein BGZ46_004076 [Entomortierella lignicola]